MSTTILEPTITVSYEELSGSPNETYDDGFRATRKLKCAWASRHTLARELMGSMTASGSNIIITRAAKYPHFERARVVNVTIAPFHSDVAASGGDTKIAAYTDAELTVQYSTNTEEERSTQDENGDPAKVLVEERVEPFTEMITLPREQLFWDAGSTQMLGEGANPGILVSGFNWVYDIKAVSLPIPSKYRTLIGQCNLNAVTSPTLGMSFPAETLLYRGPVISRQITSQGSAVGNVVLTFSYREQTWNKFYNPNTGAFASIYRGGSVHKVFTPVSFAQLIA